MKNLTKKQITILIIGIALATTLIAVAFAWFVVGVINPGVTDTDVISKVGSKLVFTDGNPLSLYATTENFEEGGGNLSSESTSTVTFTPGEDKINDTSYYSVYFDITENTFEYTTDNDTPEIILTITDQNGNEITEINGLKYVTTTDAVSNEEISGFDITTFKGIIDVKKGIEIIGSHPVDTIHEWKVKLTFVNLITDQYKNELKTLVSKLVFNQINEYDYAYTGDYQEFVVPETGLYNIELWGAEGGLTMHNGSYTGSYTEAGIEKYASYTSGNIELLKNEILYIYVGGKGTDAISGGFASGGYNGGGQGSHDFSDNESGGGGGGATDVRYFGTKIPTEDELEWNSSIGLASRIMVSAGSGGSAFNPGTFISNGGGLTGYSPSYINATQLFGYSLGIGKDATTKCGNYGCGGGAGGYYGGYTVAATDKYSGTSGSSYISGHIGCVAINAEDDQMPKEIMTNTDEFSVRYIEIGSSGNNKYEDNATVELQAFDKRGINVALNKPVIGTTSNNSYPIERLTNGNTATSDYSLVGNITTIDLESEYDLDYIKLWRYYGDGRTNYNTYVKVYNEDKTKSKFIHNYEIDGTYIETSEGKTMNLTSINTNVCMTGNNHYDCSVHYSSKVFTDTVMIDGMGYSWSNIKEEQLKMPNLDGTLNEIGEGHSGNGYAKISGPY